MVSFTPRPLYSHGKSPRYPLDSRLGGPQIRSGHGVEKKHSQTLPGIEPRSQSLYQLSYVGVSAISTYDLKMGTGTFQKDFYIKYTSDNEKFLT
jgi:hypothetical protein